MVANQRPRYQALDVLRGIAILGILFANIPSFGGTWYGEQVALISRSETGLDAAIDALRTTFVSGKFRSILAVLFGIGLFLQFEKRTREGRGWPGGYMRRMAVLALIGILHIVFLWMGDILLVYSATCLGCMWFLYAPVNNLRLITWIACGLIAVGAIGLAAICGVAEVAMPDIFREIDQTYAKEIVRERVAYAQGSYWEQVVFRTKAFATEGIFALTFGIAIAPLFLIGAILAQIGIVANPADHRSQIRKIQLWTLGIGIPLNLLGLFFFSTGSPLWLRLLTELLSGPLVAVGIVVSVIAARSETAPIRLKGILAKVGRLALTCYLLQSLIATSIFYSWGGGLLEKLSSAQMILVAIAIDVVIVIFAIAWGKRFKIGPVEWLFRKLSGDLRPRSQVTFQI
jgi:uncharacterized protein